MKMKSVIFFLTQIFISVIAELSLVRVVQSTAGKQLVDLPDLTWGPIGNNPPTDNVIDLILSERYQVKILLLIIINIITIIIIVMFIADI